MLLSDFMVWCSNEEFLYVILIKNKLQCVMSDAKCSESNLFTALLCVLLFSLPFRLFASDPEQQQTSVTDGCVCRPAVRDLHGSGCYQASVEHSGHVDIWLNICFVRFRHVSVISGTNKWRRLLKPTCEAVNLHNIKKKKTTIKHADQITSLYELVTDWVSRTQQKRYLFISKKMLEMLLLTCKAHWKTVWLRKKRGGGICCLEGYKGSASGPHLVFHFGF